MAAVGVVMTVGVYGFVAIIVKLDDLGLYLQEQTGASKYHDRLRLLGAGILWFAPFLLRFLSVAGTIAMFLVGGGIITHNIEWMHHVSTAIESHLNWIPLVGGLLKALGSMTLDTIVGVLSGAVVLAIVSGIRRMLFGSEH